MEEGRDLCQSRATSESEASPMIVEYPIPDDTDKEVNTQLSKSKAFPRSILILVHACQCGDESCSLPECHLAKKILSHIKTCKLKIRSCITCKPYFNSCRQHAKHCQDEGCPLPFCLENKDKMAEQCEDEFEYSCNHCNKYVKTRFHCPICDDFDLCIGCFIKDGHAHKMQTIRSKLGDDSAKGHQKQFDYQEIKKLANKQLIRYSEHSHQCRDGNCHLLICKKMKRLVSHFEKCKLKLNGHCIICKPLASLYCYHAKTCQQNKCLVPFCLNLKQYHQQQVAKQQLVQPIELGP